MTPTTWLRRPDRTATHPRQAASHESHLHFDRQARVWRTHAELAQIQRQAAELVAEPAGSAL